MSKKTTLYNTHINNGGKIVDFAGFLMPVSFEGIVAEHNRVREQVGLFDVSHMGEIEITGKRAAEFADYVVTNNVGSLDNGQICYTVCCNNDGYVLDDLLMYKFSPERVLIVSNASNYEKIFRHLSDVRWDDVEVNNLSEETGQIAIQGPRSRELMLGSNICRGFGDKVRDLDYYRFFSFEKDGEEIILSRTGYTGELGFEIYVPSGRTEDVWNDLEKAGNKLGVAPIGLGARDTLRFESGFCLYGNEINEDTSPLEARLSWTVKFDKDNFIGRSALAVEKENKPARKLIGLELMGRGIPRTGFKVFQNGEEVGYVTSGNYSPTFRKPLAIALIRRSIPKEVKDFEIEIRGRKLGAKRIKFPFYKGRVKD
ncbi:glycine cleavage system aminomethyltransferase GcvT [bacterium]|nr:glycine cleavage system aminomethyltransferase GcvT [bacterium]